MMKTQHQIKIASIIVSIFLIIQLASALTIKEVSSNPSTVVPGKSITLYVGIENNEGDSIKEVDISLDLGKVPFSPKTSSDVFFDEIDEGKSKTAGFGLVADAGAEAGTYKIPVMISYKINNSVKTRSTFVSATINANPVLGLSSQSVLLQGQNNKLQMQITNTGLAKAKFLSVELESGNYNLLSSNSVYVGDLNSNDFDTASFDIFISSEGIINFPVTLTYRDSVNNDYSKTENLQVRVYSREDAIKLGLITQSRTGMYVSVIVILIVLWIVYSRLRKWQKKRKTNNSGGK